MFRGSSYYRHTSWLTATYFRPVMCVNVFHGPPKSVFSLNTKAPSKVSIYPPLPTDTNSTMRLFRYTSVSGTHNFGQTVKYGIRVEVQQIYSFRLIYNLRQFSFFKDDEAVSHCFSIASNIISAFFHKYLDK